MTNTNQCQCYGMWRRKNTVGLKTFRRFANCKGSVSSLLTSLMKQPTVSLPSLQKTFFCIQNIIKRSFVTLYPTRQVSAAQNSRKARSSAAGSADQSCCLFYFLQPWPITFTVVFQIFVFSNWLLQPWHTGECHWYTTGCHICCWKVHFNICLCKIVHQLEKVAQGTDLIRSPVDQDHEGCKESREFEECLQDSFLLNLFWVTSDTGINKFCLDSQC